MKIDKLKINRMTDPIGCELRNPTASYVVSEAAGRTQAYARIAVSLQPDLSEIIYDSGKSDAMCSVAHVLPIELQPETRYYWNVEVWDETGDYAVSETAWFETGKAGAWEADWITPDLPKDVQTVLFRSAAITKPVKKARAYLCGLGLYEFYLNGEKQGEECLLPGFCVYDDWLQYQTYELDLKEGDNTFALMLGDGWYKGIYGMRVHKENYGDRLAAIAEIKVWYEDGSEEVIKTDLSWNAKKSKVVMTGIYCGEEYDATLDDSEVFGVRIMEEEKNQSLKGRLCERLSPAITIHEHIRPIAVIHTPAGETVLDLGQNMVGWFSFRTDAPFGWKMGFETGEILQEGNFYNDNLRTAKSAYTYTADGKEGTWVRQYFTFYGYRYVRLNNWYGEVKLEDFEGLVIHSDMDEIGTIVTSDPLINQLVHNAKWGQKGNFLDVPTDCPQRDERYGWTGDAQIFSGTASYTMDTYAFYTKYGKDIWFEQQKLNGSVPDVVPVANYRGDASTGWAEAATVIPWNVYLHYGDKGILERQYDSMKAWVDYMKREDDKDGAKRLWHTGYHYADWLALDGNYPGGVYGATDPNMIASGYYYYSTTLVAKAAAIIGKAEDAAFYQNLADEIRTAFIGEYFTRSGKLAIDTMTAYVLTLYFGLYPDNAYEQLCSGLMTRLKRNRYHLETGFLGTPFLCRMLSENGMNDLAYHLLMEKGYPGWLYEVLMGATTVWERWNSINPDGKISGTEMNSMNHYAYGSIVEWMYRYMLGINPEEEHAGFKHFKIAPKPNYQVSSARAEMQSAAGKIVSEWEIADGNLRFAFEIPFDAAAAIVLPDADAEALGDQLKNDGILSVKQEGKNLMIEATAGCYAFAYRPTSPYRKIYSIHSPLTELEADPKTKEVLEKYYYSIIGPNMPFKQELYTLEEHLHGPFTYISMEQQAILDARLREIE